MMPQATLVKEGCVEGVGLHTGEHCKVRLKPAPENFGIQFFKQGKKLHFSWSKPARQSSVGEGDDRVMTVEHLLAALVGLGVFNAEVHIEGGEVPALDGSAKSFVDWIRSIGILKQVMPREIYRIKEPLMCWEASKAIAIFPAESFEVAYLLQYNNPSIGTQKVDFKVSPEVFESQIAPARTFCSKEEADQIRQSGFGKGATPQNNLVIGPDGPLDNQFRFEDECARHKVLDIIGDLGLLGFSLLGRVVAIRSGHTLNQKLAQMILKQKEMTAC